MENYNDRLEDLTEDKTGFKHWIRLNNKYTPHQIAIALCNLETDYKFLEYEEERKLNAVWEIVHTMYGDAIDNGYAFLFYEILYGITKRFYENKIR